MRRPTALSMTALTLAAIGAAALLATPASGYQEWVQRIPNCGVARRNGVTWPALGHVTANGLPAARSRRDDDDGDDGGDDDASDENQFGEDFEDIGQERWTPAFCRHDSDGDGYTNGEELGDPDCVWAEGGPPPSRTWDISHPGYADSVPSGTSAAPTPAPVTQTVAEGATARQSATRSVQGGAMTYSWTVALGAAAGGADELELTMSATADHYVSWGVAPTLMDGPMIACYVPASGTGAQCSDWDGVGLTLGPRAARTRVTSWSRQGAGYTVTVRAAMSGMRVLPGVAQRVIWATGAYATGSNTPLVHTTTNRGAEEINVYSVVVGGTTLAPGAPPPTLPPTAAPPTAPVLEVTSGRPVVASPASMPTLGGRMSVGWRIFGAASVGVANASGEPLVARSRRATSGSDVIEFTLGARLGEYASVGFSPQLMDGPMVTCTVEGGTGRPFCSDWLGVGLAMTYMVPMSHVVNASVQGAWFSVTVRQRVSAAGVVAHTKQRLIVAVGPYDVASNTPLQHGAGKTDRGELIVDAYAGTVVAESQVLHIVAGVAVGSVAAVWVVAAAAINFKQIVFGPTATRAACVLSGALFVGLVAVYTGVNMAGYEANLKSQALGRALGDGAALCIWFVLYPVPKHAGVAQLMGSSYERAVPYHLLVAVVLFVVATAHFVVIAMKMPDARADIFAWRGENPALAGFVAWALLFVIVASSLLLRRVAYWLFRALHLLFVPMLVFAGLHYPKLVFALLPPLLNYVADLGLRARSHVRAQAVVGSARYDDVGGFCAVKVQLGSGAALPGAGEFVLVGAAGGGVGCALDPHPFSVAWYDAEQREALVVVKATANPSGWTRRFCDAAAAGSIAAGTRLTWLGPYGALQVPLGAARTVVLVAGGIGITPMLSILQAIREGRQGGGDVARVALLWSARDARLVEELAPQLRACGLGAAGYLADTDGKYRMAGPLLTVPERRGPSSGPFSNAATPRQNECRRAGAADEGSSSAARDWADASNGTADDGSELDVQAELFVSDAAAFEGVSERTAALFDGLQQRRVDVVTDGVRAIELMLKRAAGPQRPSSRGGAGSAQGDADAGTVAVYACGPPALMEAAGTLARERGNTLLHTETFDM